MGRYEASEELDDEVIIWIRCVFEWVDIWNMQGQGPHEPGPLHNVKHVFDRITSPMCLILCFFGPVLLKLWNYKNGIGQCHAESMMVTD